jgi:hypothetical protein
MLAIDWTHECAVVPVVAVRLVVPIEASAFREGWHGTPPQCSLSFTNFMIVHDRRKPADRLVADEMALLVPHEWQNIVIEAEQTRSRMGIQFSGSQQELELHDFESSSGVLGYSVLELEELENGPLHVNQGALFLWYLTQVTVHRFRCQVHVLHHRPLNKKPGHRRRNGLPS